MIRWLRSLFAWRDAFCTGVWLYQENSVTGRRRLVRVLDHGHQPIDRRWLAGHSSDESTS